MWPAHNRGKVPTRMQTLVGSYLCTKETLRLDHNPQHAVLSDLGLVTDVIIGRGGPSRSSYPFEVSCVLGAGHPWDDTNKPDKPDSSGR